MSKQNTALQKVIEMLDGRILFFNERKEYTMVMVLKGVKAKCESHLPEERQQIIAARESHPKQMKRLGWNVNANDGEEYFNETFESNL